MSKVGKLAPLVSMVCKIAPLASMVGKVAPLAVMVGKIAPLASRVSILQILVLRKKIQRKSAEKFIVQNGHFQIKKCILRPFWLQEIFLDGIADPHA